MANKNSLIQFAKMDMMQGAGAGPTSSNINGDFNG